MKGVVKGGGWVQADRQARIALVPVTGARAHLYCCTGCCCAALLCRSGKQGTPLCVPDMKGRE